VLSTGVQGSAGVNAVAISTTETAQIFPVGVQAQAQTGIVATSGTSQLTATGVSASAGVGIVNATSVLEVPVTGVLGTAQPGTATTTTTSSVSVQLTGVSATASTSSPEVVIESGPFPLPADSVLIWDKTSSGDPVPTGFTEIDMGTKNYLIQASTIANAGTFTSTAGTLSGTATSSSTGAHSTPWNPVGNGIAGPGIIPVTRYTASAGAHTHDASISPTTIPTDTLPSGMGIKLITNASEVSELPESTVVFADAAKTGLSRKTWSLSYGAYIAQNNALTTVGQISATAKSFSLTSTTAGAHQHNIGSTTGSGPGTSYSQNVPSGNHTHPLSTPSLNLYLYQYYKHLLPFIATTSTAVRSGVIVMFKGASVPAGWSLCDGTNGTPNLVSYFIGYNNDESSTDVVVGSRSAKNSSTAPPTTGSTSSTYTPTGIPVTLNTVTWSHFHDAPTAPTGRIVSPTVNYHTTKSVPHSHTVPSLPLTVPSSFLPNTFRLAFIRKD
jgi:hypothetical protein